MAQVFISHSHHDLKQAKCMIDWLRSQGFKEIFLDIDKISGIPPGSKWEQTLYRTITKADALILILTRNWFDSKWCFAEFVVARALGKRIFPVIEAPPGDSFVSDIQALDLVNDREGGLQQLAVELEPILRNSRGGFKWDGTRPPYPGLPFFDEDDAAIYFGRDDYILRLIEVLNASCAKGGKKLIVVLGASGSGKSSLLRAGVVPRLKRDRRNWIVLPPFRPQVHPLHNLAQAIAPGLGPHGNWQTCLESFKANELTEELWKLAFKLREAHSANEAQILITIDQMEELFRTVETEEREQFLRTLSILLNEKLPFFIVMALRSDFLGVLQKSDYLKGAYDPFSLEPMPKDRVPEIIVGPAHVADLNLDDKLIEAAKNDMPTDDALPLLAFTLHELYIRFGELTLAGYRALGTEELSPLENAVREKAEDVMKEYEAKYASQDQEALLKETFLQLVRVNANGEYVRRSAELGHLRTEVRPLIDELCKARLLVVSDAQDGEATVEVAHEALLRKWPRLRELLDDQREFLIGKERVEQDLQEWEIAPPSLKSQALLRGLKLMRARAWLLANPRHLSERVRKFIEDSIKFNERTRRRLLLGSIATALVFAAIAAAAIRQNWEVKREASYIQAKQSLSETAAGNAASGIRVALMALSKGPWYLPHPPLVSEAELALFTAEEENREKIDLLGGGCSAEFSIDGTRIITAGDSTPRLWDASGRMLAVFKGHSKFVYSAKFSRDGSRIVTASADKTATVWNIAGRSLKILKGHSGPIYYAAFNPDGTSIVTASHDHTARVWNLSTGESRVLQGHTELVRRAEFSPDGSVIATASNDNTARLWNAASGALLWTLKPSGEGDSGSIFSAEFSPTGKRLVTASADGVARVWDTASGNELAELKGHTDAVLSAMFSPDGSRIVTGSADWTAQVWDTATGASLLVLRGHNGPVRSAAFTRDGSRIVTCSDDKTAQIWDAASGSRLVVLAGHTSRINSAEFNNDGSDIVSASEDATARLWNAVAVPGLVALKGDGRDVNSVAFSPDGKWIVTASDNGTAQVWDAVTGRSLSVLRGHYLPVRSAAFSRDGRRVVTASSDKTARVWDALTGTSQAVLQGHQGPVNAAIFSPSDSRIMTFSEDGTARVWDAVSGRSLSVLCAVAETPADCSQAADDYRGGIISADFSPDGSKIVAAAENLTVRVWDAATGRIVAVLQGHRARVNSAEFNSDSSRIVTASDDETARVWDADTGRIVAVLQGHRARVNSAEFNSDGSRIVTASDDGTARVWETDKGQSLLVLRGGKSREGLSQWETMDHEAWSSEDGAALSKASFSPDGARIVTLSGDGKTEVWDVRSARSLEVPTANEAFVSTAFSPNSSDIVVSDKHTVSVWRLFPNLGSMIDYAERVVPQEISPAQNAPACTPLTVQVVKASEDTTTN